MEPRNAIADIDQASGRSTLYLHSSFMRQPRSSPPFQLPSSKRARFPGFIRPCLATPCSAVPNGGSYIHELKLDGYRVQGHLHDGRVTLYTRSGLNWTDRFATIAVDVVRL